MATNKLFPPQLDGTLPAFYKNYNDDHELLGANINIPFSLGRAVSIIEINGLSMRISTVSTNSLVLTVITDTFELTEDNIAYFTLTAEMAAKLNEGQYYRIQLAYIDNDDIVGYYSTVGVIKCVTKPTCSLNEFDITRVNIFRNTLIGIYEQDTTFGDTTEKVYRYRFVLSDKDSNILSDSDWLLHDITLDTESEFSQDKYQIFKELDQGEIGTVVYMVETINGLIVSSPPYEIMCMESVELEYPLEIYTKANFDDGCIELYLHGVYNHGLIDQGDLTGGEEAVYSGTFVITRSDEYSNFKEWREITRFIISGDYASHFGFRDFTVEQGVYYRYGIQQYNANYMYSERVLSYDITPYQLLPTKNAMVAAKEANTSVVRADFEDMFLFDGKRQLKIRFNPKMTSFKTTVLEQKTDTIGGKYPFIFKNGHTNYKEFPIGGLISYTADDSALFLSDKDLIDSHILDDDYVRNLSNPYGAREITKNGQKYRQNYTGTDKYAFLEYMYWYNNIEIRDPITKIVTKKSIYTKYTGKELVKQKQLINEKFSEEDKIQELGIVYFDPTIRTTNTGYSRRDLWLYPIDSQINPREVTGVIRNNRDLTSENMTAERYFKLKVLDWLNDGNVKLFKSPTEGNYLVRLINTQLQPQEQLGRLLHSFTSQAYEMDAISYDKLVYYKIITKSTPIITSTLWKSIDLKKRMLSTQDDGFIMLDFERRIPLHLYFDDFMPGDTIRITFAESTEPLYYFIGSTGNFDFENENRTVLTVGVKKAAEAYKEYDPIEYSRIVTYTYIGIGTSRFDAVFDLDTRIPVAETFVGPKNNLLEPYDLSPTEEIYNGGISYLASESTMVQNLMPVLKSREHINFTLGQYADKFKALTFEVLHARKRNIIPIYACENLIWDDSNQQFKLQTASGASVNNKGEIIDYEKEGTLFCTTPFKIGYINSKILYNIDSINQAIYAIEPEDLADANNIQMVNIKQLENQLPDFVGYRYEGYDILKVYVPKVSRAMETEVIYSRGEAIENTINIEESMIGITNKFSWTFDSNINCDQINIITRTRKDIIRIINKQTNNVDAVYSGKRDYFIPTPNENQSIYIQLYDLSSFDPDLYDIFTTIKNEAQRLIPCTKRDTTFYDNYKYYSTQENIINEIIIPENMIIDIEDTIGLISSLDFEENDLNAQETSIINLQTLKDFINNKENNKITLKDYNIIHELISDILSFINKYQINCETLIEKLNVLNRIGTISYTTDLGSFTDIVEPENVYHQIYDAWEENPDQEHLYYDTYTHEWWPAGQEYDTTFTVTEFPEHNPNIIYDNLANPLANETITKNPLILLHKEGISTFPSSYINESLSIEQGRYDQIIGPTIDPTTNQINRDIAQYGYGPFGLYPIYGADNNMVTIDLDQIEEFVISDMTAPDKLRVGSGVIIEVSPRLQIVEYNVEHKLNECYDYKKAYLARKQKYYDLLVGTYKDASLIDAKMATYKKLLEMISDAQGQIDKLSNAVEETNVLANALIDRLTTINYEMYSSQNNYLNKIYDLFKEMRLPTTMEDIPGNFIPLLPESVKQDYLTYIGVTSNNYNLNDRSIYNRNYYYNHRVGQFYYTPDPTALDSTLTPSDVLSFYQRTTTTDGNVEITSWSADTENGVYTLWSSENDGDIYYNQMLDKLYKAIFLTVLPGTEQNVYSLMNQLYDEIGRIPAYIRTYGDYRKWLRELLNLKVGKAYALLHYYDTLPIDADNVILNNKRKLMSINHNAEEKTVEIINHPYLSAYMPYEMTTMTDGLLYLYLSGSEDNVFSNKNLITKIQLDEEYQKTLSRISFNPIDEGPLKNLTKDMLDEVNDLAQQLLNNPTILEQRNQQPLQRSICKYTYKMLWNIENDYYYQPIWLEEGDYGPGFYGVYIFTDIGKPKARQINRETFITYNAALTEFENFTEDTTEEEKARIVNILNNSFELLKTEHDETENAIPFKLCEYQDITTKEITPETVSYEVIQKYPHDYYYDMFGCIRFNDSSQVYFDYPINLINPYNEETQSYYLDYLGDNTINIWSQLNGLLVDDPEADIIIPENIKENSAAASYYEYMKKTPKGFAKNTVLSKYYEWQTLSQGLSDVEIEYENWGNGMTTRGGYSGIGLKNIEPIEEEWNELRDIYNQLQYQMRSAVIILITEQDSNRMTIRKYNELLDLIASIIDSLGLSEESFIQFCGLNIKNTSDKTLLQDLREIKNDFGESIFDKEDSLIAQINKLFQDNSYNETIGYITDRNGEIYTYETYINLMDKNAKQALIFALPEEVLDEINSLIKQINEYQNQYLNYRYKYMIREKYNELYDVNNAVILRIRDSFIEEINDFTNKVTAAKTAYQNAYRFFVNKINELNILFWNNAPTDLGINPLILKYQESIKNGKKDKDPLNDSSIAGAIHSYWAGIEDFLQYYYATQLHNKYDINNNLLVDTAYPEGNTTLIGDNISIENKNYNDMNSTNYLEKNADTFFDDYAINYEILQSLNDIQQQYNTLIKELEENKSKYQDEQKKLNWDDSQIPSDVDLEKEKLEIMNALAWYLASLGYRYYAEVEELYKR